MKGGHASAVTPPGPSRELKSNSCNSTSSQTHTRPACSGLVGLPATTATEGTVCIQQQISWDPQLASGTPSPSHPMLVLQLAAPAEPLLGKREVTELTGEIKYQYLKKKGR